MTFPIAKLVQDVDVPEQNIATMLTYLELAPTRSWLKVKRPVSATCYIQCYGGPAHLTALAKQVTSIIVGVFVCPKFCRSHGLMCVLNSVGRMV